MPTEIWFKDDFQPSMVLPLLGCEPSAADRVRRLAQHVLCEGSGYIFVEFLARHREQRGYCLRRSRLIRWYRHRGG